MSIKLSELKNDDMLLVGENLVISKEDFVKKIKEHEGKEVYTTTEYKASIDAKDMLESAIDCEASNMYEDWEYDVWDDITEEDINELQNVIDRILGESRNIAYIADSKVEIDIIASEGDLK
ncbi:MAG: GTP-binding protein [Clostridium sp.]|nr:GTP-binding protein [Clostridium sp.]